MNINWKLRFNKTTILAVLSTAMLLGQQLGLHLPENVAEITNTVLTLLVLLGVIHDPTTQGLSDSERALRYTRAGGEEHANN